MDRSLALVTLVGLVFLMDTLAFAAPASEASYLPIRPATSGDRYWVVVESGDHFWKISRRHLKQLEGGDPPDSEIAPYWRRTITENIDTIRSGDPDLIFPGEQVRMPELP